MKDFYDAREAELFNKFSLQSFAWEYVERPALETCLQQILDANSSVLDVGCGTARIIRWYLGKQVKPQNITGLDNSKFMLRIANFNARHIEYKYADIADKDLTIKKKYSLVSAIHVFQHLDPEQLSRALRSIHDVLQDNGHLVFIVGHPARTLKWDEKYKNKNIQNITWLLRNTPWETEIREFYRASPDDYIRAVTKAGFSIKSTQSLKPIELARSHSKLFLEHSQPPSRLLVHAVKQTALASFETNPLRLQR